MTTRDATYYQEESNHEPVLEQLVLVLPDKGFKAMVVIILKELKWLSLQGILKQEISAEQYKNEFFKRIFKSRTVLDKPKRNHYG